MESNLNGINHFSTIANSYKGLRTTDIEPIDYIYTHLTSRQNLEIIDLGCGTGRYDLLLKEKLDDNCRLTGVDSNEEMLVEFSNNFKSNGYTDINPILSTIEDLTNNVVKTYDVILSFNAIHHFNLGKLLTVINQLLSQKGTAFLYTRTRNQNKRSIWGKYFPKFDYYENRLFSLKDMEEAIYDMKGIELEEIKIFTYHRSAKIEELVKQVNNRHYSTFSIYDNDELDDLIVEFETKLENEFENPNRIQWIDKNVMYKIVKS